MALFDFLPLNLNALLDALTLVFALALGWIVLRLLLRVTRMVFTIGCLGLGAAAVVAAVVAVFVKG